MPDIAQLGLKIENGQAIRAIGETNTALDRLALKGEAAAGRLKGAFVGFTAAAGIGAIMHKVIEETINAQNAMAQLEAAVKSTGGVAGFTASELDAMSASLQAVTTYSDEAIKSAQAMLLTFTNIRGDVFRDATSAVADLAARMGGDLQGAAIQVGKALNDPIQGVSALTRVGVSFTQTQKDVIKTLTESGNLAGAQAVVLRELQTEFGGSARAARDTLGGALKGLANNFGDLFEVSKSSSAGIVDAINGIGAALPTVGQKFREFFGGIALLAVDASVAWGKFLNIVHGRRELNAALDQWRQDEQNSILGISAGFTRVRQSIAAVAPATTTLDAATKQLLAEQSQELAKLTALNKAYGQSDLAIQLLTIRYDAQIERTKNAKDHTAAETAALNALTDQMAQQREVAALLANARAIEARQLHDVTEASEKYFATLKDSSAVQVIEPAVVQHGRELLKFLNELKDAGRIAAKDLPSIGLKAADIAEPIKNALRDMQSAVTGFFENVFRGGVNSFQRLADSIKEMFVKLAAQLVALKLAEKVLSPSAALALGFNSSQASQFTGSNALKPAEGAPGLGAFAMATVAVVGFASALNALTGATNRTAAEIERKMNQAVGFLATYDAQIKQIKLQAFGTPQEQARGAVTAQFDALRAQAESALGGKQFEALRNGKLAELNALEAVRLKQLEEEAALVNKQAQEDLKVRQLRAQGLDAEAEALAFQLAQQREYQKLVKDGADAITLATLAYTQAIEAAKRTADIAEAARAANQAAQDELAVRRLVAQGRDDDAARLRLQYEQARELQEKLAAGLDASTIAALKEVQALEAERAAKEAATIAAQKATQAAREIQDLDVRRLRALGDTGAADALRFQLDQQRELEDAIASNKSQEYLDKLRELLSLEAKARGAAGAVAQAVQAVDTYHKSAIGTVTSISDSQAGGILSVLGTHSIYLSRLVSIDEHLARMAVLGGSPSSGSARSGDSYSLTVQISGEEFDAIAAASPTVQSWRDQAGGRALNRTRATLGKPRS